MTTDKHPNTTPPMINASMLQQPEVPAIVQQVYLHCPWDPYDDR